MNDTIYKEIVRQLNDSHNKKLLQNNDLFGIYNEMYFSNNGSFFSSASLLTQFFLINSINPLKYINEDQYPDMYRVVLGSINCILNDIGIILEKVDYDIYRLKDINIYYYYIYVLYKDHIKIEEEL